jgi:hypothetical protein
MGDELRHCKARVSDLRSPRPSTPSWDGLTLDERVVAAHFSSSWRSSSLLSLGTRTAICAGTPAPMRSAASSPERPTADMSQPQPNPTPPHFLNLCQRQRGGLTESTHNHLRVNAIWKGAPRPGSGDALFAFYSFQRARAPLPSTKDLVWRSISAARSTTLVVPSPTCGWGGPGWRKRKGATGWGEGPNTGAQTRRAQGPRRLATWQCPQACGLPGAQCPAGSQSWRHRWRWWFACISPAPAGHEDQNERHRREWQGGSELRAERQ